MVRISACIYAQDGGIPLQETLQSISGHVQEILITLPDSNIPVSDLPAAEKILPYADTEKPCAVLQRTFSRATGDYLLWLQEGDTFTPADLSKLRALRQTLRGDVEAVRLKHAFTVGGTDTVSHYQYELRIVARHLSYTFTDDANPELLTDGKTSTYDLTITHRQDMPENYASGLPYYQSKEEQHKPFTPRDHLYYARALRDSGDGKHAAAQYEALIQEDAPKTLKIAACLELAACQTDDEKKMDTLLRSFRFGPPQADICCGIGAYLQAKNAWYESIFWYELALSQKQPVSRRTIYSDYWDYIPALELCRCYYALGDSAKAASYNQIAGEYKPGDPVVRYNQIFFAGLKNKTGK